MYEIFTGILMGAKMLFIDWPVIFINEATGKLGNVSDAKDLLAGIAAIGILLAGLIKWVIRRKYKDSFKEL